MEKFVYSKAAPATQRIIVFPCIVKRAQDGGTFAEMQLDVKFQPAEPEELAKATSPGALIGKDGNLVVYDMTVKGFAALPGAEGIPDEDLIKALRSDPEVTKAVATGYYKMVNGLLPGN